MATPRGVRSPWETALTLQRTALKSSRKRTFTTCPQCRQPFPTLGMRTRFTRSQLLIDSPARSQRRRMGSKASKDDHSIPIPATLHDQHVLVRELFTDITQDPAKTKAIPDEKSIMRVFGTYERLVELLVGRPVSAEEAVGGRKPAAPAANATSAMLKSLDKPRSGSNITNEDVLVEISTRATAIVEAPSIFITAPVLKSYIKLQSQLNRPQNFAQIFDLYRTKPAPRPSNAAPYFTLAPPSPNAPSVAVDKDVAATALAAAVKFHSLPLCLDIIDNTYFTSAYARGKVLRNATVPIAGAVLAPLAAYALASKFALLQNTMDSSHATGVAMAGIMTYTLTVGSMGYIAITSANDQMVRVTWASGTPLWERWVREEARAAVDSVAQAWGFRNRARWGDEEGPEWDMLREWAGVRGLILDRVELMPGMQ